MAAEAEMTVREQLARMGGSLYLSTIKSALLNSYNEATGGGPRGYSDTSAIIVSSEPKAPANPSTSLLSTLPPASAFSTG